MQIVASELEARHEAIGIPLFAEAEAGRQALRRIRREITVLQRDYRGELDQVHARIGAIRVSLDDLYADKDDAHASLESAKAAIDHWYRMSDCYLGNKGREIPRSRLLGRSQDDLARYKADRTAALGMLDCCREAIDEAKAIKAGLVDELKKLKAERKEMMAMRARGLSVVSLEADAIRANGAIDASDARIADYRVEQAEFEARRREELGITAREADLARMQRAREDFIGTFDSIEAKKERKDKHSRDWRASQARTVS